MHVPSDVLHDVLRMARPKYIDERKVKINAWIKATSNSRNSHEYIKRTETNETPYASPADISAKI